MCVKLPLGDLNPNPCPPHPTNIYTCEVTITPRIYGGAMSSISYRKNKKQNRGWNPWPNDRTSIKLNHSTSPDDDI